MVGVFSMFSASRSGRRRTQTALEGREEMPPTADANVVAASEMSHGINLAIEFKPVEHPSEPLDSDQPVQCPLPEPSLLNDGALWKERVSADSIQRRTDSPPSDASVGTNARRLPSDNTISHSQSAPEHNLLDLLEECIPSQD